MMLSHLPCLIGFHNYIILLDRAPRAPATFLANYSVCGARIILFEIVGPPIIVCCNTSHPYLRLLTNDDSHSSNGREGKREDG
jgi:hypothetical protein